MPCKVRLVLAAMSLTMLKAHTQEEECGAGYTCTVDRRPRVGGGEYGCAPIDNVSTFVCCSAAQQDLPGIEKWCSDTDRTKVPFCPAGGASGGGCLRGAVEGDLSVT